MRVELYAFLQKPVHFGEKFSFTQNKIKFKIFPEMAKKPEKSEHIFLVHQTIITLYQHKAGCGISYYSILMLDYSMSSFFQISSVHERW